MSEIPKYKSEVYVSTIGPTDGHEKWFQNKLDAWNAGYKFIVVLDKGKKNNFIHSLIDAGNTNKVTPLLGVIHPPTLYEDLLDDDKEDKMNCPVKYEKALSKKEVYHKKGVQETFEKTLQKAKDLGYFWFTNDLCASVFDCYFSIEDYNGMNKIKTYSELPEKAPPPQYKEEVYLSNVPNTTSKGNLEKVIAGSLGYRYFLWKGGSIVFNLIPTAHSDGFAATAFGMYMTTDIKPSVKYTDLESMNKENITMKDKPYFKEEVLHVTPDVAVYFDMQAEFAKSKGFKWFTNNHYIELGKYYDVDDMGGMNPYEDYNTLMTVAKADEAPKSKSEVYLGKLEKNAEMPNANWNKEKEKAVALGFRYISYNGKVIQTLRPTDHGKEVKYGRYMTHFTCDVKYHELPGEASIEYNPQYKEEVYMGILHDAAWQKQNAWDLGYKYYTNGANSFVWPLTLNDKGKAVTKNVKNKVKYFTLSNKHTPEDSLVIYKEDVYNPEAPENLVGPQYSTANWTYYKQEAITSGYKYIVDSLNGKVYELGKHAADAPKLIKPIIEYKDLPYKPTSESPKMEIKFKKLTDCCVSDVVKMIEKDRLIVWEDPNTMKKFRIEKSGPLHRFLSSAVAGGAGTWSMYEVVQA